MVDVSEAHLSEEEHKSPPKMEEEEKQDFSSFSYIEKCKKVGRLGPPVALFDKDSIYG